VQVSANWQHLIEAAAAFAVVGALILALNWGHWTRYGCALIATAILVPGAAAFLSIAFYLAAEDDSFNWWLNSSGTRAYVTGTLVALTAWLVGARVAKGVAAASTANQPEYARLQEMLLSLETRVAHAPAAGPDPDERKASHEEAHKQLQAAAAALAHGAVASTKWTTGAGYVETLARLHRADEALIRFDSVATVIAAAQLDDSRLDGSRVAQSRKLLDLVGSAVAQLKANPWDAPARASLARVRRTLNEFRDDRRLALVRQKGTVAATAILMATTAYSLLGIAMIWGVGRAQIAAAAAFYLVGATVGVFAQLQSLSTTTVLEEDYGLRRVRLYQTPLFCGVAAVGGVVVTAMLLALTPVATGSGEKKAQQPPPLSKIFDLENYPVNILIAAVFGLTPSLLINRLHAASEQYKQDLKSTDAAEHPPPS
jgi:hypothetical protein